MLKYCVLKDGNLMAQFFDERDARKYSKEIKGNLVLLGFRSLENQDIQKIKTKNPPKVDNDNLNKTKNIKKDIESSVSEEQAASEASTNSDVPKKRKRRTKAEMQEARRLEALAKWVRR